MYSARAASPRSSPLPYRVDSLFYTLVQGVVCTFTPLDKCGILGTHGEPAKGWVCWPWARVEHFAESRRLNDLGIPVRPVVGWIVMPQTAHATPSPTSALVQLLVAALLGLVLLPTLLGPGLGIGQGLGSISEPLAVVWLAVAIALVVWLLVIVEALSRLVDAHLASFLAARTRAAAQDTAAMLPEARLLSILVLVIGYILLGEAILRRPLATVLSVFVEPSLVDAVVAAVALVLVLALLVWLYRTARPLVKDATWYVLDGILATSGSDRVQRFYEADETRAAVTAVASEVETSRLADATVAKEEATVSDHGERSALTQVASTADTEATRLAPDDDVEATRLAPSDDADATRLAPTDDQTLFQPKPPTNSYQAKDG